MLMYSNDKYLNFQGNQLHDYCFWIAPFLITATELLSVRRLIRLDIRKNSISSLGMQFKKQCLLIFQK